MAKDFEEMDSTGMFGHLMDQADWLEDLAEKYRHLAATMILEAQDFGKNTADLLAKEFPMGNVNDNA
jgi:hypothetical protein